MRLRLRFGGLWRGIRWWERGGGVRGDGRGDHGRHDGCVSLMSGAPWLNLNVLDLRVLYSHLSHLRNPTNIPNQRDWIVSTSAAQVRQLLAAVAGAPGAMSLLVSPKDERFPYICQ